MKLKSKIILATVVVVLFYVGGFFTAYRMFSYKKPSDKDKDKISIQVTDENGNKTNVNEYSYRVDKDTIGVKTKIDNKEVEIVIKKELIPEYRYLKMNSSFGGGVVYGYRNKYGVEAECILLYTYRYKQVSFSVGSIFSNTTAKAVGLISYNFNIDRIDL